MSIGEKQALPDGDSPNPNIKVVDGKMELAVFIP